MGQFKPMVKMFTDEPKVILKLKKGGKVSAKGHGSHGHKSMSNSMGSLNTADSAFDAEAGSSPKKPSLSERRRSMNPNQYKSGGKVAKKQLGGAMPVRGRPMPRSAAAAMAAKKAGAMGGKPGLQPGKAAPMDQRALDAMRPQIDAVAPQPQIAVAPMPKMGNITGDSSKAQAEMEAFKNAKYGTPSSQTMTPNAISYADQMKMRGMTPTQVPMKKGGSTCAKVGKELKRHEKMEASKAHGKASGGKIDSAETKTTVKTSTKPFAKTKMHDGDKTDRAHGTGGVKEGKPGGYKTGGTIAGNVSKFAKTKVYDGDKTDKAHGTGDVRMGNSGGYKAGGNVGWENRPANTSKKGVSGTSTGEVKEANAGGYKHGGAAKKGYATGGNVVDTGKAEKMPRHPVSRPVANSLQSGTFKRGGKVSRYAEGGSSKPISLAQQRQGEKDWRKGEEEWNESFRPEKLIGRAVDKVKGFFSQKPVTPPPGSVTKTEKSVTVAPKKRGGKC